LFEADHVFEPQIFTNFLHDFLNGLEETVRQTICGKVESKLDELQEKINSVDNLRFVSEKINRAKGTLFLRGKLTNSEFEDPIRQYLVNEDIYTSFSKTRTEMITIFRGILTEVNEDPKKIDVERTIDSFSTFSRSTYESAAGRDLPARQNLPAVQSYNGSSTLQLSYLPGILSMILSLVVLYKP